MKDEDKTKQQLIDELKMLRWLMENTKSEEAERKRLEESLRESEEKVTILFNANPDSIILINLKGTVLTANKSCAEQVGRSIDELAGSSLYDIFPQDVIEYRRSRIEEVIFTGARVHFEDTCNERFYDHYIYPLLDETGHASKLVMISSDISEKKNLEKSLQEWELKYHHTYEIVAEGIFQTAPDGHFLSVNNALARIYGYASPEDMMRSVSDITRQHYVDPSCRSEFTRLLEKEGIIYNFEAQMYRKDKTMIWVSINARAIRNRKKKILYYEGTVEDISKRKRLEAQLVQSQKTEAIGRLAGGIAHNFNNLLTIIMGNFELLLNEPLLQGIESREIRTIQETIRQTLVLCEQLLSLSRRQLIRPVETNINTTVVKMEEMLKHLLSEDIVFSLSVDPDIRTIKADPSLIEQIVLILAVNARDAMPRGGTLQISTENVYLDSTRDTITQDMMSGDCVMLKILDTGNGILPAILEHIFEPFYTIKPDGTGLGLSIVHSIVKQSGGSITVDSEEGKGTTFRIYFPVVTRKEKAEEETPFYPTESAPSSKATVLVVEDESGILYWVTDVLQGLGYTVLSAFNAEEAISSLDKHAGPVDLLITDLVLPGKHGQELAETLKIRYPGMKVILMSGYSDDQISDFDTLKHETAFLSKPFTPLLLLMKVQEALEH